MPAGPELLGFGYFVGVKLAGYTVAGHAFNRLYLTTKPAPIVFGAARTALGVAVGVTFSIFAAMLDLGSVDFLFYVALAPFRFGEWLLVLAIFYWRGRPERTRSPGLAVAASLWSYLLDVPAIVAMFALPGGVWVC